MGCYCPLPCSTQHLTVTTVWRGEGRLSELFYAELFTIIVHTHMSNSDLYKQTILGVDFLCVFLNRSSLFILGLLFVYFLLVVGSFIASTK